MSGTAVLSLEVLNASELIQIKHEDLYQIPPAVVFPSKVKNRGSCVSHSSYGCALNDGIIFMVARC